MSDNNFAVERLESRQEQFCVLIPYIGTCYKTVWFVRIPYPCLKYYWYCF